ncbi:MAG: tRNA (N6-isopentenyl adenosine(37)-C2)-methylthiotransferase MiaB [Eubacteriales bacterium]
MFNNNLLYHISTYGCQMNVHESEKIAGIFEKKGFVKAASNDVADIILFNTCCIRDSAEKKILGNLGVIKHIKAHNPKLKVIVCGCMTQQENTAKKLITRFPFIDAVLGTNSIQELPGAIDKLFSDTGKIINVYETKEIYESSEVKRNTYPLSYVNIMYGCNNFCSYCIVPYVRGRERSRKEKDIINEIAGLKEAGYKEVTLLGQNVNSYGNDLNDGSSFAKLLAEIDENTGIDRLRFMTSHPKDLSDELIYAIRDVKSVCNYMHLPIQSGSDRILGLMNRKYTRGDYLRLIEKLRKANPSIALSTDIIVGFPSETEEDFKDTLNLVKEVGFDSAFMFKYSKRTGTKAANMPKQVSMGDKTLRINALVELQKQLCFKSNLKDVGRVFKVLVENTSVRDDTHFCGRSDTNKMVNFFSDKDLIGKIVDVEITQAKRTTLFGKLV